MKTASEITQALAHCIGTEGYHRYPIGGILLTDGVKALADMAECYWLIDIIASYQGKKLSRLCDGFQLWEIIKHTDDAKAIVTCRPDSDASPVVRQVIGYTDFPLPSQKLYLCNGVLMLPSEY